MEPVTREYLVAAVAGYQDFIEYVRVELRRVQNGAPPRLVTRNIINRIEDPSCLTLEKSMDVYKRIQDEIVVAEVNYGPGGRDIAEDIDAHIAEDLSPSEHERPMIVCLTGSTRFKEEYEKLERKLTLEGKIVLTVGLFGHCEEVFPDAETKKRLDELHLRKIDLAGMVTVVCPGGYIGDSTRREIEYARSLGKPIMYWNGMDDAAQDIADHALADGTDPRVWKGLREIADEIFKNTKRGTPTGFLSVPPDVYDIFVRELVSRGMSEGKAVATVELVRLVVGPHAVFTKEDFEKLGPVDGKHGEIHMMEFRSVGPHLPEPRGGNLTFVQRMLKKLLRKRSE